MELFKPSIVETGVLPGGSQHARWITDFTEQRGGLGRLAKFYRGVDEVEFKVLLMTAESR